MAAAVLAVLLASATVEGAAIGKTVHNLSASGPGAAKEAEVGEICIFCHTPHNVAPTRGLWNRQLPAVTYKLYQSSTLEAKLNQPTGASRLCLSCHDGTVALGALRVKPRGRPLALGPLKGRASLGTDLSDDHPISFVYDAALAMRRDELADPSVLPPVVRLDETRQLQCTTCHDPHEDRYGAFLVLDNRGSRLCIACHQIRGWGGSAHATSPATWKGSGENPWSGTSYNTVAENGCLNCHRSHAAGQPVRLLRWAKEEENCFVCHSGRVAAKDLEREFRKVSAHPVERTDWVHDPKEDPATMKRHVTCVDCHNVHAVRAGPRTPPLVPPSMRGVAGVNLAGGKVAEANFEYEVCLKCHGVTEETSPRVIRQDGTGNIRLKIEPSNPSFHPLAAVGRNTGIAGLEPGYTASSLIACTDCHNSDEAAISGPAIPRGPHGSRYPPLLERDYPVADPSLESFQSYALCYKCHNRTSLLGDQSGFPHRRHVVDGRASCVVCHDPHGSRQSPALINFALRFRTGEDLVKPSGSGRLEFRSLGRGRGECFLSCHRVEHAPKRY